MLSGERARPRAAAAGMMSIAAISSAPTTLSATATTTASARVRTSPSRSASIPEAAASSRDRVAVRSRDQRQAMSAITSAAPPQITTRSVALTARMSPNRKAERSTRTLGTKEIATRPRARAAWASTPRAASIAWPRADSQLTAAAIASATTSVPSEIGSERISASATPRTAAWAVASPK